MVLIESNGRRRKHLATALRSAGMTVVAVGCIGELERWPAGDVVVTESAFFTPWWKHVGATHVVVLADSPTLGMAACGLGATAWISRSCAPHILLAALRKLRLAPVTTVANVSCLS
jgi:hypothetical protein